MKKQILIVEDEIRMRMLLKDYFEKEDFDILEADNGITALNIFKNNENSLSLIILDLMMPLMDGFTLCKSLRDISYIPIIILTARSSDDDKLLCYDLGADDYVTKPFSPKILVAKSKALLKRSASLNITNITCKNIQGLVINTASHEVYVDEEEIYLTPNEYNLLLYLMQNQGISLSRDKILDNVWGIDYYGDPRTVDTTIKRLREKLKEKSSFISTVRGSGYKFEVKK
ncbi:response regulator with CheY-like receiver domain and winged-helix DNA-binding domain [Clostridium putrefaciens]|uniref:Stage 0 sporulation protein A homolog n=1 Tax=Clostridium putrefaciens TaxID=99675 RepID=A0A381J921_9CLOT|nr:response regulator transcription factor [Clostridium putrefaciens]SUY46936.1 response regulator with CheY-like receiver domain and winged-helix DNA-binding domain [Clostridium putrefaciens]